MALAAKYGGAAKLASIMNFSKSYLSALIGKSARSPIGDQAARNIEDRLGLPSGWLDSTHKSSGVNGELLVRALELVLSVCAEEDIVLHARKLAKVVAVTYQRLESGTVSKVEVRELVDIAR